MRRATPPGLEEAVLAFEALEVGPVRLEPRRLVCPYRITPLGSRAPTESVDLIYRYEEDVFDAREPESRNLARMVAAQVALNYGLFSRGIRFHGLFDDEDLGFLRAMAENTAREIYVNKLLKPNPFLIGAAARLSEGPPEIRGSYCVAEISGCRDVDAGVSDADHASWRTDQRHLRTEQQHWRTDPRRCAVLSSGGKESLLSFGLLHELGLETHPIFVNESGRHWFTALNAYRSFRGEVPHTTRVWTNADRVFSWMARHLPFIRPDFARLRSDEYPIRMWTVAVFLFGALPLLRSRGIGRLLIGDEYDTTRRANLGPVAHYDGLYDQSLDFDRAMSRYYRLKGWNVHQLSVLRPLSEAFGLKILAERYPRLQRLQVSCHAAHPADGKMQPCGRCEKCRRVVGMLCAVGADPAACGYSPRQVGNCLAALEREGSVQETQDAQDLLALLGARGLLAGGSTSSHGRTAAQRAGARLFTVREDAERAPLEEIPDDWRKPLLGIYKSHAARAG